MTSVMGYGDMQWQNTDASVKIQHRIKKYIAMSSLSHDAHCVIIHTPKQMKQLISIVSSHMENGKLGHRMYINKNYINTQSEARGADRII